MNPIVNPSSAPPSSDGSSGGCAPRSWDLDLADAGDGGALGHVVRQQPERICFAVGVDRPPDRVPAGAARGQGRAVAKRALVPFERDEHHAALVRLVAVVEQVAGHEPNLPSRGWADIGGSP